MSLPNLRALASNRPQDAALIDKLDGFLTPGREYTFDRLVELTGADEATLSLILGELVKHKFLHQIFRVESPAGGGIDDFESFKDVPVTIKDWRAGDREIPVTSRNLRIVYEPTTDGV
ncbi:MAG: hypothetical protein WCF18_02110 [Chthoniobacteraceae bacterium]